MSLPFVNWLKDTCEPLGGPLQKEGIPSKAILWKHPVTGTQYYLEASQAGEITRPGLALAMVLLKEKGADYAAEKLSDFFAQRDIFERKRWLKENGFLNTELRDTDGVVINHVPHMGPPQVSLLFREQGLAGLRKDGGLLYETYESRAGDTGHFRLNQDWRISCRPEGNILRLRHVGSHDYVNDNP